MRYTKILTLAGLLAAAPLSSPALAANGHYVPGVEGIGGPAVPPPGVYYRGYLVRYDIDNLRDGQANKAPGKNTGEVTALANRFIWITDKTFLGANYGVETIIPLQNTSLDFRGVGVKDSDSGLGDIFVGPVVLGWHGQQWDAVFAAGHWFETASYEPTEPASIGKGHGTTMLTLGGNWHFDADKNWSFSALSRYEIKTEQDDTGVTPGDSYLIEWALSHRLDTGLDIGLVGYEAWQLEGDKGGSTDKAEKHALGAEAGYFWPNHGLGLNAAFYQEYNNEAGPEGALLRLHLTKVF
ncbi:transporter [Marinobacter sp. 1-4A]|uniref:SphA family protein n=1 Tax=Marinobacter sp. 1-4A TaxID=2582919 RepID=UPI0019033DE2|nr:transporter [Marinobacter sp. 1-4A]MBK1851271.1 transporter [Marinobacter sp. 1-4A]